MTYEEANKVLDQIRNGQGAGFNEAEIYLALWHTGDFRPPTFVRSQGVGEEVPGKDWRARCRERAILVGKSKE